MFTYLLLQRCVISFDVLRVLKTTARDQLLTASLATAVENKSGHTGLHIPSIAFRHLVGGKML